MSKTKKLNQQTIDANNKTCICLAIMKIISRDREREDATEVKNWLFQIPIMIQKMMTKNEDY